MGVVDSRYLSKQEDIGREEIKEDKKSLKTVVTVFLLWFTNEGKMAGAVFQGFYSPQSPI